MTLAEAVLVYTMQLMSATNNGMKYDDAVMNDTLAAIVAVTNDVQEVETLIKIARWESGGFRKEVASCKVKGDNGLARGLFQVHPFTKQQVIDTCSGNYQDQVRVALARVRDSAIICKMHGMKGSDLLTGYTRGQCHRGDMAAIMRWGDGKKLQRLIYTEYNVILSKKGAILLSSNALN